MCLYDENIQVYIKGLPIPATVMIERTCSTLRTSSSITVNTTNTANTAPAKNAIFLKIMYTHVHGNVKHKYCFRTCNNNGPTLSI